MADDKENVRKSYAALQLQRKKVAAAADTAALPRVAAAAGTRPLSRGRTAPARPQNAGAAGRMGFKPATHSTHLVPLLDAMAPCRSIPAPAPAPASAASRTPEPIPAVSPVPASPIASVIGDPSLDGAEAALQAELAMADRRLELLQSQQLYRRSVTPAPGLALSTGLCTPSPAALPDSQEAGSMQAAATPEQVHSRQPTPQQAQDEDLLPPPPAQEAPAVPPEDQSIVRSVTTATGIGCKGIIAAHTGAAQPAGACWTTRGHRVLHLESSCILQLLGRSTLDIMLRINFTDAGSVPSLVRLEHAPSPTAAFERLGDIQLQRKSLKQLRHVFRLGKSLAVQRFLRITLVGHMAPEHSGAHRVSHMLLTSSLGQQRTQSALSQAPDAVRSSVSLCAPSGQASVSHAAAQAAPAADSAASASPSIPAQEEASPQAAALAEEWDEQICDAAAASGLTARYLPDGHADALSVHSVEPALHASGCWAPSASPSCAASSASGHSGDEVDQRSGQAPPAALHPPPAQDSEDQLAQQAGIGVWGTMEDSGEADVDYAALMADFGSSCEEAEQEAAADPEQPPHIVGHGRQGETCTSSRAASPMMLLSMQRCSSVEAALTRLGKTPQQVKDSIVRLLDPSKPDSSAAGLSDAQLDDLLACMPSAEEQALLLGFAGQAADLGVPEQLMLQLMQLPALAERVEAMRCAAKSEACIADAGAAASVLGAACSEVTHSGLLRTLLRVSLLAGNFLTAGNRDGASSGFQVDALLKLKDVRSSRARTPTLLHFVAREAARQHPEGPNLAAALPSAEAAAAVDVASARAALSRMAGEARQVEQALAAALAGIEDGAAAAELATFRSGVLDRAEAVLAELEDAEAAFRHLGSFINAQRATLADPTAFFGVLHAFAEELEAAHQENATLDGAATSAASNAPGRSKDSNARRPSESPTPPSSMAVSFDAAVRHRADSIGPAGGTQESASLAGQQGAQQTQPPAAERAAAALERLKQASLERLQLAAPDSNSVQGEGAGRSRQRRQHSPLPCLSRAAIAGIGGTRRGVGSSSPGSSGGSSGAPAHAAPRSPPAASSVDTAVLLQQAGEAAGAAPRLSTPVVNLLAESARLISSVECPEGGFGSAVGSANDGEGSSSDAQAWSAVQRDTAATPDGAVCSVSITAGEDAGCSTPRDTISLGWLSRDPQEQPYAVAGREQAQDGGPGAQQHGPSQPRYTGTASTEAEVPALAAEARAGAPPVAAASTPVERSVAALSARGLHGPGLSQLRQRSQQQLSPTSTPLSSLGRQSSAYSSAYSSDGSTPRSSLRTRTSLLQRSTSPLGLGAPGAQAEAPPRGPGSGAAQPGEQQAVHGRDDFAFAEQPSPAQRLAAAGLPLRSGSVPPSAGATQQQQAEQPLEPADAGQAAAAWEQEAAPVLPAREFGALHSRASSCDLTFYAPFSMDREGPSAFDSSGQAVQGLSANFSYDQDQGSPWGPLAAAQQKKLPGSCLLRHTSADEGMLLSATAAAAVPKRAAFSMPSSPRRGMDGQAGGRLPAPLDLRALAERLRGSAEAGGVRSGGGSRRASQVLPQRQQPALSPVLEALLSMAPAQRDLAPEDLADLGGLSSDQEAEWQQLERMEQQDAALQQQQRQAEESRELMLAQQPASGQQAQQRGDRDEGASAADGARQAELARLLPFGTGATGDLDAAMARLLASAGNTPTGPLGLGLRTAPADVFSGYQGAARAPSAGLNVSFLEPLMPAPLGEGVRVSGTFADNVPGGALRGSVEGPRTMQHDQRAAAPVAGRPVAAEAGLDSEVYDVWMGEAGVSMQQGTAGGPIRRRRGLGRFLPAGGWRYN